MTRPAFSGDGLFPEARLLPKQRKEKRRADEAASRKKNEDGHTERERREIELAKPASAQEQPLKFGFTVGLNLATVDAPADTDVGVRSLLAGGVVAQTDVVGPISVQSQLLLEQKGTLVRGADAAIRYGATYVDLPLFLRIEGPTLGSVTLYGLAGGFGGVKLFETQRAGSQGLSLPLDTNTSFFRRTNAGILGGVGGMISTGGGRRLDLVVQYSYGLVNVAQSVDEQPFERALFPREAATRTWSIMLRLGL